MNILFVASRLPYPPNWGDKNRAFGQIKFLSKKHNIFLVAPIWSEKKDSIIELNKFCKKIYTVQVNKWLQILHLFYGLLFSSKPLQNYYYNPPQLKKLINSLTTNKKFDLIHIQLMRMVDNVPEITESPLVVDLLDSFTLNLKRWFKSEKNILLKMAIGIEYFRTKKYESFLCQKYSHLIVCSNKDRLVLGNGNNIYLVPLGIDASRFRIQKKIATEQSILFYGNMTYKPNTQAILWFVKNVFPKVVTRHPHVTLKIAGVSSERLKHLETTENIKVLGEVPSIQKVIMDSMVCVAPMQSGSGMQFKVIESMSCGKPVVLSSFATGGLEDAHHGKEFLLANSDIDFAKQINLLIENKVLRDQIGKNANKYIKSKLNINTSMSKLENVYKQAIYAKQHKADPRKQFSTRSSINLQQK